MGGGAQMDPRDTPGYRRFRALTTLKRIDRDRLSLPDRLWFTIAIGALERVTCETQSFDDS